MDSDRSFRRASIRTQLRTGVLARATHFIRTRRSAAIDFPGFWFLDCAHVPAARAHDYGQTGWRAAGFLRGGGDLFGSIEYRRENGSARQCGAGCQRLLWFLQQRAGESLWPEDRSASARRRANDLRFSAALDTWICHRRKSVSFSLDVDGDPVAGLFGDSRLGGRFRILLLAGTAHGCHPYHGHRSRDSGSSRHTRNDRAAREVELAPVCGRCLHYLRHRTDHFAKAKEDFPCPGSREGSISQTLNYYVNRINQSRSEEHTSELQSH